MVRLRRVARLTRIHCEYVEFFLVDASTSEIAAVERISVDLLGRLANAVASQLEVDAIPKRMVLIGVGKAVELNRLPAVIRDAPYLRQGSGLWIPRCGIGVVPLGNGSRVQRTIIHELVHGLLDQFSDGFKFPRALEEGFASTSEALLTYNMRKPKQSQIPLCDSGPLNQTESAKGNVSIDRLLGLLENGSNSKEYTDEDYEASVMGTWLHAFLTRMGRDNRKIRNILGKIQRNGLRSGREIHIWLMSATGLTESELDAQFAEFCRGKPPR